MRRSGLALLLCLLFLLGILLVSASINSSNYQIDSPVESSGGDSNMSSGTYDMGAIVGMITGTINSPTYQNKLGFYHTASGTFPVFPEVEINSTDGSNETHSDLNCFATLIDQDLDTMNASVKWYKNGALNLSLEHNNDYTNGTLFVSTLNSSNTTSGENWSCSVRIFDGELYSDWSNSTNLTILNSLPTVNLTSPLDWSATDNRSPEFNWTGFDYDGNSLTYEIEINEFQYAGAASCNDDTDEDVGGDEYYIPSSDLLCLHDNGFYYEWRVRANDGIADGPWSETWVVNITALVDISLDDTQMNFGSIAPGDVEASDDDIPQPFVLNNDGNCIINVSLNSTAIWDEESSEGPYYQFKADNLSGEEGAANWALSIVDWFNMSITGQVVGLANFTYADGEDSAEFDIRLEAPLTESPGVKLANITFFGGLSE
jgi:hypothetical protein